MVHVLTPNRSHAEISIAALEAGKHVMCEKPMAKTAADARKMVEAAYQTKNYWLRRSSRKGVYDGTAEGNGLE